MPAGEDSEEESDNEEVDEAEVERMRQIASKKQGGRSSVVAERTVFKADWKPPVYQKTPEQAEQIRKALAKSFMFQSLPDENLQEVIDAFAGPHLLKPGSEVIRQGDLVASGEPGLYILERGRLEVYKRGSDEPHPGKRVFAYSEMGQSFGELALLYSCPRAATVVVSREAIRDAVLWSIDRDTFNYCVKDGYRKMRERRESFIESVEILRSLTHDERMKIVDVIQSSTYSDGAAIIRVGEVGDRFYMVEQGRCAASVNGQTVKEYGPGDYFGELALLKSQTRVADVFATASPTTVVFLDADTFRRLLGPLSDLLEQRAKDYSPLQNGFNVDGAMSGASFLERWLGVFCSCTTLSRPSEAKA